VSFHACHFNWMLRRNGEVVVLFGVATGRVPYAPAARWLYSFRLFLGPCKVEVLWRTGEPQPNAPGRAGE